MPTDETECVCVCVCYPHQAYDGALASGADDLICPPFVNFSFLPMKEGDGGEKMAFKSSKSSVF